MAFLSVVGLTACSDDEPKDSVKEIRMQVSAETGVMYAWGDDKKENPIECMLANPPADGSDRTYSLIRILQDRLVTEPGWFRPYVFAYPYSPRQTCDRTGNSGR